MGVSATAFQMSMPQQLRGYRILFSPLCHSPKAVACTPTSIQVGLACDESDLELRRPKASKGVWSNRVTCGIPALNWVERRRPCSIEGESCRIPT